MSAVRLDQLRVHHLAEPSDQQAAGMSVCVHLNIGSSVCAYMRACARVLRVLKRYECVRACVCV